MLSRKWKMEIEPASENIVDAGIAGAGGKLADHIIGHEVIDALGRVDGNFHNHMVRQRRSPRRIFVYGDRRRLSRRRRLTRINDIWISMPDGRQLLIPA